MKGWLRFLMLLGGLALLLVAPAIAQEEVYFPTTEWRTSTPEEQGMDSATLADFVNELPTLETVDSLIIIRNGYIVTEVYWHPYTREMDHQWNSVSKNVTSTLIGIALDLGFLNSLDEPVLSFFPEYTVDNLDDHKRAMTIRDLLTMQSGFDCRLDGYPSTDPIEELATTADAIQLGLDWRMADEPGTTWRYCQINTYLLMAILERTSGMPVMEFAMQHLFTPLGISQVDWLTSQQGIPLGYTGLYLHPLDMAKIGYLYLMRGRWQGQQIVSSAWIDASTTRTQGDTQDSTYGYQWWIFSQPGDFFTGIGAQGQFVAVYPQENLIVVLNASTSAANGEVTSIPISRLMPEIVRSLLSEEAVPGNPSGMAALEAAVSGAQQPTARQVRPLPQIATQISGLTYLLDEPWNVTGGYYLSAPRMSGEWQVTALTFDFTPSPPTMALQFADNTVLTIPIGLDGIYYRTVEHEDGAVAATGGWMGTRFGINLRFLMNTYRLNLMCSLTEEEISCPISSPWGILPTIQGSVTRAA